MNHNPQKIPRVSPYEIWYYIGREACRFLDGIERGPQIANLVAFQDTISRPLGWLPARHAANDRGLEVIVRAVHLEQRACNYPPRSPADSQGPRPLLDHVRQR